VKRVSLPFVLPLTLCVSLVAMSGWLLLHSVPALAATCTAKCRTGSVTCEGTDCKAEDYVGCWANGGTIKIECSSGGSGPGTILP
jgi:hypothetical protein